MPITDLSGGLPWWANQGGPTGGPGAAPQGGGAASAPAGGQPPGVSPQDWLAYLQQMFGVSPAEAGELKTLRGDDLMPKGPPPQPSFSPLAGGSANTGLPVQPPPAPVATTTQPYGGPMAAADAAHAPTGGAYSHMPFPGQRDPQGFWGPLPSAGPMAAGGPISPANRGGEGAVGGASGNGSTSNPRFTMIDRPNAPAEGGGMARGGPPMASALNLAGLFNRGQGGPNPNAPAANAQPVAATRPVPGPLANAPMPPTMPADVMAQRVRNAIRTPNWWQNL